MVFISAKINKTLQLGVMDTSIMVFISAKRNKTLQLGVMDTSIMVFISAQRNKTHFNSDSHSNLFWHCCSSALNVCGSALYYCIVLNNIIMTV